MKTAEKFKGWYKTSERLPRKWGYYLCYAKYFIMGKEQYGYKNLWYGKPKDVGFVSYQLGFHEFCDEIGSAIKYDTLYWIPFGKVKRIK